MDMIIDAAFIVAITAFFKDKLGLTGWSTLLAAFLVGLGVYLSPLIGTTFPAVGPWLSAVVEFFKLFLAAVGTPNLFTQFAAGMARARNYN